MSHRAGDSATGEWRRRGRRLVVVRRRRRRRRHHHRRRHRSGPHAASPRYRRLPEVPDHKETGDDDVRCRRTQPKRWL